MHSTVLSAATTAGPAPQVIEPHHDAYDEARASWNLHADLRPAGVVTARTVADVQGAVRHAADRGLRIALTTTGHFATAMPALDDALLLRTALDEPITIDVAARRARVPAGALAEGLVRAAAEHGLAVAHGSSPDVGVVGYLLGGGLSFYGRRHGLAVNHVRAFEIVDAEGALRRVDAEHDPELFWALRGGGGSFGVVCAVEVELFALTEAFAGMIAWPIARAPEVLAAWLEWTRDAPDTVTTSARLLRLPPLPHLPEPLRGVPVVAVDGVALDAEDGQALVTRLMAAAGDPTLNSWATISTVDVLRVHGDPEQPVPAMSEHALLGDLDEQGLDALLRVAGDGAPCPLLFAELRQLGGALAVAPEGAGVCGRLDARFSLFSVGVPMDPALVAPITGALAGLREALAPWETGREFLNLSERGGSARPCHDEDAYTRLAAVHERCDPQRRFVTGHTID